MTDLFAHLKLPNGSTVPNRICKAAMEENMCGPGQLPSPELIALYRRWALGGAGLILTGNVMVAPDALTGPGGVVLTKDTLSGGSARTAFEAWAAAGEAGQGQLWMQISHPGRQVYAAQGTQPVSASATKVSISGAKKMFVPARALSADEAAEMTAKFADTAEAAQQAGFDGVQIHAAHGYLVSQFLSPLTNLRNDKYGGSLENRARFLLDIVKAVRARVGKDFGVAVKLNSADFQRGGFDADDAAQVVEWLGDLPVDFVELSGGSYESAAMAGAAEDSEMSSSLQREVYFLSFAETIAKSAKMPIMVTGGITKKASAQLAMSGSGVALVGIAKAMAFAPDLPNDWAEGQNEMVYVPQPGFKNKVLRVLSAMALTKAQLHLIGEGRPPNPNLGPLLTVIKDRLRIGRLNKRYKTWLADGAKQ